MPSVTRCCREKEAGEFFSVVEKYNTSFESTT